MFAWSLPINTGFLLITFLKKNVPLSLLVPNMLRLSVERKLRKKCVVLDTFGKSAQAILDKLLENPAVKCYNKVVAGVANQI